MLPLSQIPYSTSSSQSSIYGSLHSLNYADVAGSFGSQSFVTQSLQDASLTAPDPNSPEAFKQNIHITLGQLVRVQSLASSAIAGIEHAYRPGTSPLQTAADMASLKQAVQALVEFLGQTGVGALPLLDPSILPTEQQLMDDSKKAIQVLYDRHKRMQESSAVAANLLTTVDQSARR